MNARARLVAQLTSLMIGAAACAPDDAADEGLSQPSDELELYGKPSYAGDCTPAAKELADRSLRWGRTASNSVAYAQCIQNAFTNGVDGIGPYKVCRTSKKGEEPLQDLPMDAQIERAIAAARSYTDIHQNCRGGSGNASAKVGAYGHTAADTFKWAGGRLDDIAASLPNPVCTPAMEPGCRWAGYPWPYTQMAETIWHEVAHTNGYVHGHNEDNEKAQKTCGYEGDPSWHFQVNTAPYIIGNCIARTLEHSARVCGEGFETACGRGKMLLASGDGAGDCTCVEEPGWRVIRSSANRVMVGGQGVFITDDADVPHRYVPESNSWVQVGGPGRHFAVNNQGLFAATPDGVHVYRMLSDNNWERIGTGASAWLYASGDSLYSIGSPGREIWKWNGTVDSWTRIGPPAQMHVAVENELFALTPGGEQVMRWSGIPEVWNAIGGASDNMLGGGQHLFVVERSSQELHRFDLASGTWSTWGGPGKRFEATLTDVYGQTPDGMQIWKHSSSALGPWTQVAGAGITNLYGGGRYVVAKHASGELMMLVNP